MVLLLEEPCRKILIENLCPETIWEVYTYSITFGDDGLREGCREYFRKKVKPIEEAIESPTFLTIPYEVLLELVQINDSNANQPWDVEKLGILISDKELFSACQKWAVAECKRQELEPTGPNKRKVLRDCFPLIRFPCMLTGDIINLVSPTEMLSEEQKASLLKTPPTVQHSFLSTMQHFPLEIRFEMDYRLGNAIRTDVRLCCSTSDRRPARSSVILTPHRRLALSQVWVVPRYYGYGTTGQQRSKFEVVIHAKSKVRNRQTVVSQVIGTKEYPVMSVVELEPFVLDAHCAYTVKVHDKELQDQDPRRTLAKEEYQSLRDKIRFPADVDLEITDDKTNTWISAMTVHLV